MKRIVDGLSADHALIAVPAALLLAYGLLRLSSTLFNELRDIVFVKVAQRSMRRIALEVFHHLHALSLRFHLERQTGGLTRDIERGTRGISTLLSFTVFSVLPTLLEIAMVTGLLIYKFDVWFGVISVAAVALYVMLTFVISEWRTAHRRRMNELDSKANTRAIDSLLNYETVKYFGNESFEARALRQEPRELRARRGDERDVAGAAERHAGRGDRGRGVAAHVARGRGHRERRTSRWATS